MVDSILDMEKNKRFLSKKEWEVHPERKLVKEESRLLCDYLYASETLRLLRETSASIRQELATKNGDKIQGPLGDTHPLDVTAWRNSYSSLLQEFEAALVSNTLMGVRNQVSLDVILPSHDGVLVITPVDPKRILTLFTQETRRTATLLGASNPDPLSWEVKEF